MYLRAAFQLPQLMLWDYRAALIASAISSLDDADTLMGEPTAGIYGEVLRPSPSPYLQPSNIQQPERESSRKGRTLSIFSVKLTIFVTWEV